MANAVKTYNGGSAFLLKPNGIDSRTVNKLLYTPSQIPQQNILANYDPAHPDCYAGTGTSMFDLTSNNNDGVLLGGLETGYSQNGWFEGDGVNDKFETTSNVTVNSNQITFGAWFKVDGSSTLAYQFAMAISSKILIGAQYNSGQWRFWSRVQDGSGVGRQRATAFGDVLGDTWYFGAVTYDNVGGGTTGALRLYLYDSTGLSATTNRLDSAADFVTNNLTDKVTTHASGAGLSASTVGEMFLFNGVALIEGRLTSIYNNTKKRYGY